MIVRLLCNKIAKLFLFCQSLLIFIFAKKNSCREFYKIKIDISYYVGKNIVSDEICPICQCYFKKNELITKLNKCGHTFYSECVFVWLQNNETCPICRETNLFEKVNSKKRKLESN